MKRFFSFVMANFLLVGSALAADWPQWLGEKRDGIWREEGLLKKFPEKGLTVLWRKPLGAGYAGPAVVNGKVLVMDRQKALDKEGKPVKVDRGQPQPGKETLHCFDAKTGESIWTHEYSCPYLMSYGSGPRTTPTVDGKFIYMLGGMGHMKCLELDTGKVVWEKYLPDDYKLSADWMGMLKSKTPEEIPPTTPAWGYAAHLLIDGDILYSLVGGKGSAVVAFDKKSGKELWRALTAVEVCYAPPMIYEIGGTRQLIIWLDESINSLDPKTGKVYWTVEHPKVKLQRPAVAIHTPRLLGDKLFFSTFYNGSVVLQVTGGDKPSAKVAWKSKSDDPSKPDALHIMMAPPLMKEGHVFGICAFGELRCLNLSDGKEAWNTLVPVFTKSQYAEREKRYKKALAGETPPPEKPKSKNEDEPPSTDSTGKPKMKGVDCGNIFIIPLGEKGERYLLCNDQGELIISEISTKGYKEIDRTKFIEPDHPARGRDVVWSHPAFANKSIYARNDKEIVCVSFSE